ncbi:MAG: enhanced intracellular survival protein Eis [Candidatus Thorarchaeota archaeon]
MTIRRARIEDKDSLGKLARYSFNPPEWIREIIDSTFSQFHDQFYLVEDDGRPIARARMIPFEQNIRGVWKRMGGIASVSSAPETRRKGHIRDLMIFLLKEMHESDIPFTTLYPFKEEFYARFGYVPSQPKMMFQIKADTLRLWDVPEDYTVLRIPLKDGFEYAKKIYSDSIDSIHGSVKRGDEIWREYLAIENEYAFVLKGSEPLAYMRYRIEGFGSFSGGDRDGRLFCSEMHWSDIEARNALLNYMYGHVDQVVTVKVPVAPINQDYWHWTKRFNIGDTKIEATGVHMARIVDVVSCLSDIPVSGTDSITVEVKDAICDWNNAIYELTSDGTHLNAKTSDTKEVDARITIEGLTSLVYGTGSVETLVATKWLTGTKLDVLGRWFEPRLPWLTVDF